MAAGYSYVLAEAASEIALRLPRSEQHRLATVCRLLATTPLRAGDYATKDDTGRVLQNLLIDDWVLTFWADHAVKELRITEVVQV
ncbi:MAG: hypothetical protein ABIZ81_03660 [Opitutaceae bacterium]